MKSAPHFLLATSMPNRALNAVSSVLAEITNSRGLIHLQIFTFSVIFIRNSEATCYFRAKLNKKGELLNSPFESSVEFRVKVYRACDGMSPDKPNTSP